jgi:hypothetical protein
MPRSGVEVSPTCGPQESVKRSNTAAPPAPIATRPTREAPGSCAGPPIAVQFAPSSAEYAACTSLPSERSRRSTAASAGRPGASAPLRAAGSARTLRSVIRSSNRAAPVAVRVNVAVANAFWPSPSDRHSTRPARSPGAPSVPVASRAVAVHPPAGVSCRTTLRAVATVASSSPGRTASASCPPATSAPPASGRSMLQRVPSSAVPANSSVVHGTAAAAVRASSPHRASTAAVRPAAMYRDRARHGRPAVSGRAPVRHVEVRPVSGGA